LNFNKKSYNQEKLYNVTCVLVYISLSPIQMDTQPKIPIELEEEKK